ncbi:helix-turn-helix domain-containing protein [Parahaliea aestuarii]|uniref:ImmA/IrrE family metallo-endopeptidase n=1 Tax=Parahaliea aestuarii TaxID=1852021 RepID=A0A5C8ZL57_9GAMM|nr:XRE family transcriptional regulator [Parahaliea aestuarii]TXS88955.1 ImmA/IrrE family metallo-endopeptidase [Parahaliea aestuarii]
MPAVGVKNFIGERLVQAKNARGLSSVALSDLAGISSSSISLYEANKQNPKVETVESLARALNVPVNFFFKDIQVDRPGKLFYRSMAAATKASRVVSEAKYEWALETVDYLLTFFDLPKLNLPDQDVPEDFKSLDTNRIECIANELRAYWNLGTSPVASMTRTLEANGIIVWRTKFGAETQDAFSEYRTPHPFVILSSDKQNYFRSRFDAAHELGHLVLHRNVDRSTLNKSSDHKLMESQAHLFAGAFLAPAEAYYRDLYAVSLDAFRALKPRWNVSIAMQIMRARHLGLVTEHEERRLWINMGRRKWRVSEPLDDSTEPESPKLIKQGIKMLIEEGVKSREQILDDLSLHANDVENLIGERGYLHLGTSSRPVFKASAGKVVPFRKN